MNNMNHNLTKEDLEKCYITTEGNIITPRGNLTGEQVYKEWLENKDKQTKNTEENLIDKLILDNINMQTQIDNLIQANLGGN